jgi:hypothetical protein
MYKLTGCERVAFINLTPNVSKFTIKLPMSLPSASIKNDTVRSDAIGVDRPLSTAVTRKPGLLKMYGTKIMTLPGLPA